MSTRAIAMHLPARNVNESATQVWDFTSETTLVPCGAEFIWTNDTGDPTDVDHAYATHGHVGGGFDDGTRRGMACAAIESGANPTNPHNDSRTTDAIRILDPVTGEVIGRASVTGFGNGTLTLTWSQRVPVGKECQIAVLAYFNWLYHVVASDQDVSSIPFAPKHLQVVSSLEIDVGNQGLGFLSVGFASKMASLTQGSRSFNFFAGKTAPSSRVLRGYVSDQYVYSDPGHSGSQDTWAKIASMTSNGWTLGDASWFGGIFAAIGYPGVVPLKGGVVHWQNGTTVSGGPYSVTGASGTPFFAHATFGKIAALDSIINGTSAEPFGFGFVDDRGVAYSAALKMSQMAQTASSRITRRLCDVERMTLVDGSPGRMAIDWAGFASGGMTYDLAGDVAAAWQVTQFVGLPVNPVD